MNPGATFPFFPVGWGFSAGAAGFLVSGFCAGSGLAAASGVGWGVTPETTGAAGLGAGRIKAFTWSA